MATILRFEDLDIWQSARQLAHEVFDAYNNSEQFCRDFKLKEQINASSGSVMDNIAEGFERSSRNEFVNFLSIAKGSCGEVRSQLYRALDRNYISQELFNSLKDRTEALAGKIGAFINYLNGSSYKGNKFKNRVN
ncbi:MAG: four helix bundle protein [Chitinophagaceae bacterium]